MDWFVIQVRTGKETEFRKLSLSLLPPELRLELYVPTRTLKIRVRSREQEKNLPVYPGYVFCTVETIRPEQIHAYRSVPGFHRWLGEGGRPQAMRKDDLYVLKLLLSHGEILGISQARYDENMRIQVMAGPLKGLEGRIVKVDKRKRRARVRLDLYDDRFEVDFGFEMIGGSDNSEPESAESRKSGSQGR